MLKDNLLKVAGQTASGGGGGGTAEEVSFDGVTDYMSRSSDLVGNTDGKTFTFSCWVYITRISAQFYVVKTGNRFQITLSGNKLKIYGGNTADNGVTLEMLTVDDVPFNTFLHILISIDMANQSGSKIYINDKEMDTTAPTFVNQDIKRTNPDIYIATNGVGSFIHGRLSNMFLSYDYRDLSIETNRRLFITADGKPAEGLASLNPIMYLPLTEAATAHINESGTGDFIQNGLLETADRGANQPNCVMSSGFDGSNYLSHATETGVTLAYWYIDADDRMTLYYENGTPSFGDVTSAISHTIGEVYLTDANIPESEFTDDNGRGIPARTVMANNGDNAKICLPISADAPEINYGSGGNFVLNGGGLSGSRGASEYQGRTIVSDASNKVTGSIFCKSLVKWIDNVVSYHNDVTITESDAGTVGYYFGFSDTIDWNLEASKNLVTNQLGYMRQPSQVISDSGWTGVLGLFFEDTTNFGLNTYGNDFSVTGSPTAGADITI